MKIVLAALVAAFSTGSVMAADISCHPMPAVGLCAHLEFLNPPVKSTSNAFVVTFTKLNSTATKTGPLEIPFGEVDVVLMMNMGHHGHGTSPVTVNTYGDGVYYVTKGNFTMPGSWEVRLSITGLRGGDDVSIPVTVR
jgi:hypothetical protein